MVRGGVMDFSRRGFLALAGPGLFVFFGVERVSAYQQEPGRLPGRQAGPADFNGYLRIGADGRVTCFAGKVELGQGAGTVLAQILAEELDVAYESVDVVLSDTDVCPYDMGTFGSMNVPVLGPALRAAGAEARAVLRQMAAEHLGVPADGLQLKNGVVTDAASGKHVAYAQLVEGKRIERHLAKVPPKPVKSYSVVGHSAARKDALEKVTGKAKFTGDFTPPGLLHARLVKPPVHGAKLIAADTSLAEKFGAQVVKQGDMVAVLHERPDVADEALRLVKAQFDSPQPSVDDASIFDHLLKTAPLYREFARVLRKGGYAVVTDFHPDAIRRGHARAFRDASGAAHVVEHVVHDADAHEAAAREAGLTFDAAGSLGVGVEVQPFYERAKKLDRYTADLGLPLLLALRFSK